MDILIEGNAPESNALVAPDETGIRFGIDVGLFEQWRRGIPEEDLEAFVYYRGDTGLAKFVCAFDYLTHRKRVPQVTAIVNAYAAAFNLDPSTFACRTRAFEAFEHPAVQYLLEQFASGGLRDARERAVPKFSKLLESVLDQGTRARNLSQKIRALDAGTRFLKMMQTENRERHKRTVVVEAPRPVGRGRTINQAPAVVDLSKGATSDAPPEE